MAKNQTTIRGNARNVQWREKSNYTVLTFNIEQTDKGNVVGYMPVELREIMIKGTLVDGDEIEATGEIDPDGILIPKKIHNLRTDTWITRPQIRTKWAIVWLFPLVFMIIGGVIGGIMGIINGSIGDAIKGLVFGLGYGLFVGVALMMVTITLYTFVYMFINTYKK